MLIQNLQSYNGFCPSKTGFQGQSFLNDQALTVQSGALVQQGSIAADIEKIAARAGVTAEKAARDLMALQVATDKLSGEYPIVRVTVNNDKLEIGITRRPSAVAKTDTANPPSIYTFQNPANKGETLTMYINRVIKKLTTF